MMNRVVAGFVLLAVLFTASAASAQVWVNGKQLTSSEVAWLSNYSCGPIPAGAYWINLVNGYWGYWGSARVVGHVRDRCSGGQRRVFKDGNMSREGRLFYPGELLN